MVRAKVDMNNVQTKSMKFLTSVSSSRLRAQQFSESTRKASPSDKCQCGPMLSIGFLPAIKK